MSGIEQRPEADAPSAEASSTSAASTDATPAVGVRAPLTSLSSLLGGVGEGGEACAADGTCH